MIAQIKKYLCVKIFSPSCESFSSSPRCSAAGSRNKRCQIEGRRTRMGWGTRLKAAAAAAAAAVSQIRFSQ